MAENRGIGLILMFILILILTPDSTIQPRQPSGESILDRANRELGELTNSTYGVPGNVTGLEEIGHLDKDGHVRLLPPVQVRTTVKNMIADIMGPSHDSGIDRIHSEPNDSSKTSENTQAEVQNLDGADDEDDDRGLGGTRKSKHLGGRQLPIIHKDKPIYHNATGAMYGGWHRLYEIEPYDPSNSTEEVQRNVTGTHGDFQVRIVEDTPGDVHVIGVRMGIQHEGGYSDIHMNGVHFVETGDMVVTTNSRTFSGYFALPHFALNKDEFNSSKTVLIPDIKEAISRFEETGDGGSLWPYSAENFGDEPPVQCEFIAYFQLHPVYSEPLPPIEFTVWDPRYWVRYFFDPVPITSEILREIEQELRYPSGVPVPPAPKIEISGVIYSPNCGYVLKADRAVGEKVELYRSKVRTFALLAATVAALQTWLLIRQMNESNTPSTVSRVSFWAIAMLCVVDGYKGEAFLLFASVSESTSLALMTAALATLLMVIVFGMRFLISIWGIQRPERRAAAARRAAVAAAAEASRNANPPGSPRLPAPVTATAQTPLIVPPETPAAIPTATTPTPADDDGRRDVSRIYTRLFFMLIGGSFLFLHVSTWSPLYRHAFIHVCMVLANSFWVPQIYRNVMRGCRKALSWEFIIGTSILKFLPVAYVTLYDGNVFHYTNDWKAAVVVAGWLTLQIVVLWIQEWAGPRLFVPNNLLPPAYDYHPILPVDDLEAAQPSSSAASISSATPHTTPLRTFDCAICMQPVEVLTSNTSAPSSITSTGGIAQLVTRRSYMVTPCRHVFHSPCLENWMRYRLQCPNCRNQLPPL